MPRDLAAYQAMIRVYAEFVWRFQLQSQIVFDEAWRVRAIGKRASGFCWEKTLPIERGTTLPTPARSLRDTACLSPASGSPALAFCPGSLWRADSAGFERFRGASVDMAKEASVAAPQAHYRLPFRPGALRRSPKPDSAKFRVWARNSTKSPLPVRFTKRLLDDTGIDHIAPRRAQLKSPRPSLPPNHRLETYGDCSGRRSQSHAQATLDDAVPGGVSLSS
jgi:hypothetical protein